MLLLVVALFSIATASAGGSSAYIKVGEFFASCDSLIEKLSYNSAVRSSNLTTSSKAMAKVNDNFPSIKNFIRTNSEGKIIAKAENGKVVPRSVHKFRYVGKQKWFKIIKLSKKPYYGFYNSGSTYYLFWNRPILKKGAYKGAIAAKINMKKAFKQIASENDLEFSASVAGKKIYSNLSTTKGTVVSKISVPGISNITLRFFDSGSSSAVKEVEKKEAVVTETKAPSEKNVAAVVNNDKKKGKDKKLDKKAKKKADKIAKKAKKAKKKKGKKASEDKAQTVADTTAQAKDVAAEKSGGAGGIILMILMVLALGGVATAVVMMIKIKNKREKELLEAIDRGEV